MNLALWDRLDLTENIPTKNEMKLVHKYLNYDPPLGDELWKTLFCLIGPM